MEDLSHKEQQMFELSYRLRNGQNSHILYSFSDIFSQPLGQQSTSNKNCSQKPVKLVKQQNGLQISQTTANHCDQLTKVETVV